MTEFPYEDIVKLPRPVSKKRRPMPIANRAAQFAPFAALTGYDDAVEETARFTEKQIELEEYEKEEIGRQLYEIKENIKKMPAVHMTYFVPDASKDGGEYAEFDGRIKKVDEINKTVITEHNNTIYMDFIIKMQIIN